MKTDAFAAGKSSLKGVWFARNAKARNLNKKPNQE